MTEPLLNPSTKRQLARVIDNPPHALLLNGPASVGKNHIAEWLIEQWQVEPHVLRILPEKSKSSIGIEAVRELEHFTSLKMSSHQTVNRLVLIPDAELLTTEAQNAMLKTLEEPPVGTLIILTCSDSETLLPTIRSRVQTTEIRKPQAADVQRLLTSENSAQIMALSAGLPGLAIALDKGDSGHPMVAAAATARQLLQSSTFERLTAVDRLSKDKPATGNLLFILMQMAHAALLSGRTPERWQQVLEASYKADSLIKRGAQAKLVLTKLMLSL